MTARISQQPSETTGCADIPTCACHGLPMTWNADKRRKDGGFWRCLEKRREYNKRRQAQRIEWMRADYNAKPRQRRYVLARQRARIEERLSQLSEEANALESQP